MHTEQETEALLEYLENLLFVLSRANYTPRGSCCACLQDVEAMGHLPSCIISQALVKVEEWRE
jgi:hypothetical protein